MSRRTRGRRQSVKNLNVCVKRCGSVRGGRCSIEGRHNRWPLTADVSTHLLVILEKRWGAIWCHVAEMKTLKKFAAKIPSSQVLGEIGENFPPAKITRYMLVCHVQSQPMGFHRTSTTHIARAREQCLTWYSSSTLHNMLVLV